MKLSFKKILLLSCAIISPLAYADAPVVDMTQNTSTAAAPAVSLSLDQRVTVLERQLSAMNQIDLVNQVSHLEQQVQDLQGQVQVLSHTLQTVQTQTTSQYADLDKRLSAASTPTPAPVIATDKTTTTADDDQTLYDSAYKNIKEQKNSLGIEDMKKYLEKYPDGKNAPNAHYWLGQLYVLKGDQKSVKAAVSEFDTVIKKYPKSDKVKEANLKLGFAYLLQNKDKEAKLQFKKVMKDYPGTTTAQLAQARLAQLG